MAPAPKSGMGGKVIAAILAVVVIIGIIAVIKVAGGPDEVETVAAEAEEEVEEPTEAEVEEVAEADTTDQEVPEETVPEEAPAPEEPVREEPSAEEQLSTLIQDRVGPYQLASVESGQEFAVNSGATGAVFAGYSAPNGGGVFHIVAAYPSEDIANRVLKQAAKGSVRGGARLVDVGPVKIDGRRTGTWVLLQGKTESVLWTNGVLFAIADGAHPHPIKFFTNVSY